MAPESGLDKAGNRLARDTLSRYARYAELIAQQETALDDGDLQTFEALDEELKALQQQIGLPPDEAERLGSDPLSDPSSDAIESLRTAQATHARIQSRLASLKDEAGTELRQLARGGSQGRRYLEASTSIEDEDEDTPHIDVTL